MIPLLRRAPVAVALAVALVVGATVRPAEAGDYDAAHLSPLAMHSLTAEGSDRMVLTTGTATARVAAPATNRGTNTRVVVWAPATTMAVDQQSCATWSSASVPNVQQGITLRLRHDPSGRWRAVTVMKNVLYGAVWQFNVLTWDSHGSPTMSPRGAVNLEAVFRPGGVVASLPWKVCARAVGDIVTMKAWRAGEAEPAWGDASHGGSVRLPPGWAYAGKAGWYIGHVPPGGWGSMISMRTATLG